MLAGLLGGLSSSSPVAGGFGRLLSDDVPGRVVAKGEQHQRGKVRHDVVTIVRQRVSAVALGYARVVRPMTAGRE